METTTIVVLSVLSTLVIIGLIAMANGLRKAQKEITKLLEDQRTNEATHDAIHHRIDEECHEIRQIIKQDFNGINQQIEKLIDGVSEQIAQTNRNVDQLENNVNNRIDDTLQRADEQYGNISRHTEETWKEWTSDLDRRFDRLYQMIYEAFPHLKK
jgi:uncharacterized membrane-anchored protein YjiN (DUF445 family)